MNFSGKAQKSQSKKILPMQKSSQPVQEQELITKAELFYKQKDWQTTIEICQKVLENNPNVAEAYKLWGNSLQQLGQEQQAIELYNKALTINPDFAEVYANMGSIYARSQNWEQALTYYIKAVNLNPNLAGVYRNLAKVYRELGHEDQAIEASYQAALLAPERITTDNYCQLGNELLKQEKFSEASNCFHRILESQSDFLPAYQKLAEIAEKQGNLEQASIFYTRVIELQTKANNSNIQKELSNSSLAIPAQQEGVNKAVASSNDQSTLSTEKSSQNLVKSSATESAGELFNLGNTHAEKKQWQEAIKYYQKSLKINPQFVEVYLNLAKLYSKIGQVEKAVECWQKIEQLKPNTAKAEDYYDLGDSFLRQKKSTKAIDYYRQALELQADFSPAYHRIGAILTQEGKTQEAKQCYQQAIKYNAKDTQSYVLLGEILDRENQWYDAKNYYEQAIDIAPNNWAAYHALGDIYLKREKYWEKAASCYRQAIKLNTTFSWSYHNLGETCLKLQLWSEAKTFLTQAIQINPNFHWSHYNLGEALMELEEWEEAIEAYQQAIEIEADIPYVEEKIAYAKQKQLQTNFQRTTLEYYLGQIQKNPNNLDLYYQALEIDPKNFQLQVELGQALLLQKGLEKAVDYWHRIISQQPNLLEAYLYLAQALETDRRKDRREEILACHRHIIRIVNFDYQFYISLYEDLQLLTFEQAYFHWLNQGRKEKRFANPQELVESFGFAESDLPQNFDWEEYLQLNPDLRKQGKIKSKWQAIAHFLSQGLAERRKYGQDTSDGWQIYLKWGDNLKIQGKLPESILAYHSSIFINPHQYRSYQHLGDAFLFVNKLEEAGIAYIKALELNPYSFWASCNLASIYTQKKRWSEASQRYHQAIKINPLVNLPHRQLKNLLNQQWEESLRQTDDYLARDNREKANEILKQSIKNHQNGQYISPVTIAKQIPEKPSILLVVDDFLPQCLHYRVKQKIEQIKYAGLSVEWVSWRNIATARNRLHFAHVVIFYRVPALPEVIETIAYAQAIKKVVFYEIDDLIFDEDKYPDPFETYGGQITKHEYFGLIRGTILFKEAMAMCDYAIASTPSLATAMEVNVIKQKVWVHRNALDSHNLDFLRLKVPKFKRDYLSIFYGTGTKAHNTDFNQLVAPALVKILQKYPQVRLKIIGYLTIPTILKPYCQQIDQVEIIKDIKIYWEFLKQADINIAVLKRTAFNNSKSELKWFEAASLQVPSVVSNTETFLGVIEDGVNGFIASNPQEWLEKLELLINDRELRSTIARNAYKKAWKNYNIPVMSNKIKQIIQAGIEGAIADGKLEPRRTKIKLLIVNVFYPPQSIGGATRVVKDNVDILQEKYGDKYEVSIFTTDNDNPIPYHITEYSHDDIWVTKVSTPMQEKMDWQYQNSQIYDIFKQYLEFNQPDLIHFHCVQRLTGSVLEAAADLKIPYCVTVHDAWWISDYQFLVNEEGEECDYQQNDPVVARQDTTNLTDSLYRRRYLQQGLNCAQAILAVSETFTDIYRANGFQKTQPNRNGIIPKPKLPRQPSSGHRVRLAHVGGISAHKGYDLLEDVIKTNRFPNLEFCSQH